MGLSCGGRGLIVERGRGNKVVVRYRDQDGKRAKKTYEENPYCYVHEKDIYGLQVPCRVDDRPYEGLYLSLIHI